MSTRPKILFVGDSHSYSAWNFNEVANILGEREIASVAMGGYSLDTSPILLSRIEKSFHIPRVIVLGTSLHQFSEYPDKEKQIHEHEKVLAEVSGPWSLWGSWNLIDLTQSWLRKSFPSRPASLQETNFSTHSAKIALLPKEQGERVLENVASEARVHWEKFATAIEFSGSIEMRIHQFCEFITAHRIRLFVIAIPESPFLMNKYSKADTDRYHQELAKFKACADRVVTASIGEFGIDSRHFLNREMAADYPYDEIARGESPWQNE